MDLKPIRGDKAYESMLDWVDRQFDNKPELGSKAGDDLQVALLLIKAYEDEHYAVPSPDPIEAIKLKMDDKGLKSKDLVEWVGSKSYVSALLNRKKPLTLKLAKVFHEKLGIPSQVLLSTSF